MAYCPKCGIGVEGDNRPCPLCNFPIPKVNEENETVVRVTKFPQAENPYPAYFRGVLNRIFVFLTFVVFLATCIMFYIDYELNEMWTWSKYSNLSILAVWVLLYFSFGYVQSSYKVIIGIGLDALVLLFGLDSFNGTLEWFFPLALPIVAGTTVISLGYWSVIRVLSVRRFNVIGLFFISLVLLTMWINFFIQSYRNETNLLHWIIITVLQLIPVLLVMIYVQYGMPERIKQKIARKFHL